ncbi:MAG: phosphatidate cytidylyltransferase [Cyanobacteria bacterium M_surface_7_m2_040]|nr:phosphatidate cytidylyltransferase [Cyanobacteria bacterium M_surface_7_m2_040]
MASAPPPAPRKATSLARLLSGWAAGAFGFVVVLLGGWWFTIAVGVMVHLGLREFFRMAQFKGMRPATKTTLVTVQLLLLTTMAASGGPGGGWFAQDLAAAVLPVSGAVICGWLLLQPRTGTIADVAASIFGLFYLGYLPSHWIRLRELPDGLGLALTLTACFMVVGTDIGSYVIGRRLGRRPLSPISPGKTVEGALGGLACSMLVGVIGGVAIAATAGPRATVAFTPALGLLAAAVGAGLGAVVALMALVGDLTESMMKRDAGIKDSGDAIPGHGGMLDRIDSFLFAPAVVYGLVSLVLPWLNAG